MSTDALKGSVPLKCLTLPQTKGSSVEMLHPANHCSDYFHTVINTNIMVIMLCYC